MKILLVDDSRPMRKLVLRALRQAGYGDHDYVEAGNGVEGLEMVAKEDPDLILSDWNMPELDGMGFLVKLRESGDQTPFGFVTTEGGSDMRLKATEAGADFLLAKPFTTEDIGRVMKTYF